MHRHIGGTRRWIGGLYNVDWFSRASRVSSVIRVQDKVSVSVGPMCRCINYLQSCILSTVAELVFTSLHGFD